MSELSPVKLTFNGKDYEVSSQDGIWGLIESIEDVVTYLELLPEILNGKYRTARIFRAYASALNYAGCKVTPAEIRDECDYKDMGEMAGALAKILQMAQPTKEVMDLGGASGNETKAPPKKKATPKRSSRSTKRGSTGSA